MALTLALTGMAPTTESELRAAFQMANAETGGAWTLVDDDTADYYIVDMDSLYGPMSWLRLHAAGRKVIGLTSVDRDDADYRLTHPVGARDLSVLLSEIALDQGLSDAGGGEPGPRGEKVPTAANAGAAQPAHDPLVAVGDDIDMVGGAEPAAPDAPRAAAPVGSTAAQAAGDDDPIADDHAAETADAHAPEADDPDRVAGDPSPPAPSVRVDAPSDEPPREPVQEPAAQRLQQWLQPGRLRGRLRLQPGDAAVALLIDADQRTWHGPDALKPLAGLFADPLDEADFIPVDAGEWNARAAAAGPAQPLQRLQWLAGLLSGTPTDGAYRLSKWPRTEREYPKHFRIATVMMKGPATLPEIAQASGVELADVVAFVNANLATGYAEWVPPEAPAPEPPPPRSGGLFGRMRGR